MKDRDVWKELHRMHLAICHLLKIFHCPLNSNHMLQNSKTIEHILKY